MPVGCEVTISSDKGVPRIHAEIVVDAMEASEPVGNRSCIFSTVWIRDCSTYGTFIERNSSIKEKVHECPGGETYLKNWELVSFGMGNATYRYCYFLEFYLFTFVLMNYFLLDDKLFAWKVSGYYNVDVSWCCMFYFVPLRFYLCSFTNSQVALSTQDRGSSIPLCCVIFSCFIMTLLYISNYLFIFSLLLLYVCASANWSRYRIWTWKHAVISKVENSAFFKRAAGDGVPEVMCYTIDANTSFLGACVTHTWTTECTHVIVDPFMPEIEEIVDTIAAKKPLVLSTWLEYKFGDRMRLLLEVAGAKVLSVEDFDSDSQHLGYAEIDRLVLVTPAASADQFPPMRLSVRNKRDQFDFCCYIRIFRPIKSYIPIWKEKWKVVVSSSCSTSERIVADSDAETETATSDHPITDNALARSADDESEQPTFSEHATVTSEATQRTEFTEQNSRTMVREEDKQAIEYESKEYKSLNHTASMGNDHTMKNFVEPNRAVARKREDNPELGNVDILYSQNLIFRDTNLQSTGNATESGVINFERFRKVSAACVSFHDETYNCDYHGCDFAFVASTCYVLPPPPNGLIFLCAFILLY
ncbi:hypothetical protein Cgig2_022691 [Carnegiea gigantea]|uniref:FHA domain-containing protein n=1 Tax=Carnegiea gigantea TaxID=171969 RepID=A0A9Q1JSA9_9CARY|nr:hypothetical protein Cgig2_022691 [Carnegiea gigantea]